jgi:hypothetical protein
MNWATSLEQIWPSPSFPMWLTLGVAGFFELIVLITLLRASKSLANGALTVITLLAITVACAATIRSYGPPGQGVAANTAATPSLMPPPVTASLPALSCLDELAGETVLAACEKVVFGSAESAAAAVSYTAAQLNRLTAYGDVATANKAITAELASLRRAVERDRFGLVAHVLLTRDNCQIGACAVYASLTTRDEIAAHMEQRTYDTLVARYAPAWNAPPPTPAAPGVVALSGLPPSLPTGKPTNADFPTSASIPPVNIMTPEPPVRATRSPPAEAQASAPPAPKKQAAPKPPRPVQSAPVQLAPPPAAADN